MEKAELTKILALHRKWLNDEEGGERASLSNANLSGANLRDANLSCAVLHGANFFDANLCGANFFDANLCGANLSGAKSFDADLHCAGLLGADLRGAGLLGADLRGAGLLGADLRGADLRGADLSGADLRDADLSGANLRGAKLFDTDLRGAKLTDVTTNEITIGFYPQCPEEGSFIAYKKARLDKIVVLKIPEDAKRSSATTFKCRCDKAEVLRIENLDGSISDLKEVSSAYNNDFVYRVGETVFADSFDENRWNECSNGIHFFISRELARKYKT